jgi:hypothetical protein
LGFGLLTGIERSLSRMAMGASRSVPRSVSSTVVPALEPSGAMPVSAGVGNVACEKALAVKAREIKKVK